MQTSDDGAAVDSGEKSDSIAAQLVRLIDDQSEGKRSPRS
jgi:hypothetical protein